jgi:hypothetical protein
MIPFWRLPSRERFAVTLAACIPSRRTVTVRCMD